MLKRRLGKTELMVSTKGFGGIKLPVVERKVAHKLLNQALDYGINFFDTARAYSNSEEKIGEAISERRDEFYLSIRAEKSIDVSIMSKV